MLSKISGSFNWYKLLSVSPCVASANHASWFLLSFMLIPVAGVTPQVKTRDGMDFCLSLLLHAMCPTSFFSCAESLALSFRHLIRSKGGVLFCFFPQNKCFIASEKIMLICACLLIPKPSLLPCTCWHRIFCSHRGSWLEEPIWLENTPLFFPSVSCQLLPFPGPVYHLVIQALGAGEWPGSLLNPMARPAVQELRNLSQGGEISISRWQIRAPQLLP